MSSKITWIEASAGCGKTTNIVKRITDLLEAGVPGSAILCLSFTKNAAAEMKARIKTASKIRCDTIHAFAMSIISEHVNWKILDPQTQSLIIKEAIEIEFTDEWTQIFTEAELGISSINGMIEDLVKDSAKLPSVDKLQTQLLANPPKANFVLQRYIKNILLSENLGDLVSIIESNDPRLYLQYIVSPQGKLNDSLLLDQIKNSNRYPEIMSGYMDILNSILEYTLRYNEYLGVRSSIKINILAKKVAKTYRRILASKRLMEYDDIIAKATTNIDPSKLIGVKHVFLDEAQDTSQAQVTFLMQSVFSEITQHSDYSITIVGDRKQLIYEFNNSSEETFDSLKRALMNIAEGTGALWVEESLSMSYRYGPRIAEFVDKMMHGSFYSCSHVAASQKRGQICAWTKLNSNIQYTVTWDIRQEQEISDSIKLCIQMIKEIKARELLNETRLAEDNDICIIVPKRCLSVYILATELIKNGISIKEAPFIIPSNGMIEEFIHVAEIALMQSDLSIISVLKGPFFQWSYEEIQDLCINRQHQIIWDELKNKTDEKSTYARQIMIEWMHWSKDAFRFYSKLFFHSVYGEYMRKNLYEETLAFWDKVLEMKNSNLILYDFITHIDSTRNFAMPKNGISILTAHSAKGRESNIIILFNGHTISINNQMNYILYGNLAYFRGNYPTYKKLRNMQKIEQIKASQRLMYVAITRAREQLYFIPPIDYENIANYSFYAKIIETYPGITQEKNIYVISD